MDSTPIRRRFIRHSGLSLKQKSNVSRRLLLLFDIFRELKRVAHHPIVFILTDNNSLSASNNPHLLFPLSIIDELRIEQIRCDQPDTEELVRLSERGTMSIALVSMRSLQPT